jgi:hypothetical protein
MSEQRYGLWFRNKRHPEWESVYLQGVSQEQCDRIMAHNGPGGPVKREIAALLAEGKEEEFERMLRDFEGTEYLILPWGENPDNPSARTQS